MHDQHMNMDEHETVLALLPWEANRTLAGDERPRVAAHLAHCAACRSELDLLERSFAIASRAPRVEAATIDAGWRRMTARLDDDDARRAKTASPGWRPALAQALGKLWPASGWGFAGSAMAAAAVAAIVVGYPLLTPSADDAPYRVLTSAPNGSAAEAALQLRVKFKSNTSPALLAQWLADARTPTTLRRESATQYLVELPPPADFQAMNRVFEQLSRRTEVEDVQIVVQGK
jgi:Putative zinc-finger